MKTAVLQIGERLRQARMRRGVSVRGLARSVDVSASLISQIETGKSSPSVSTLYAITTALGISIEEVFAARSELAPEIDPVPPGPASLAPAAVTAAAGQATDNAPPANAASAISAAAQGFQMLASQRRIGPVVRAHEREALHLDSGVTWELLGQLPGTHVDFLRITYAPGGSSSSGGLLMRHSGTEYGHVLNGQLTLTLGFDTHVLGPGDSVSFDSSTPHAYANHATEPAIGVWFVLERLR